MLLGDYEGVSNAISAPSPITYLAVTLKAGERWRYCPAAGHETLWIAVGKGRVASPDIVSFGEMVIFEPGSGAVEFIAQEDAEFVLGSGCRHGHDLVLGYYSVHTSATSGATSGRLRRRCCPVQY